MFEALPQIQRYSSNIVQLQKQCYQLRSMLSKSRSDGIKVQKQVANTIDGTISKAKSNLGLCEQLQKQIENQQFISSSFMVQDLVYDIGQLPQWFSFVFQKQFEKQRSGFNAMAKKLYKQHGLYQKKNQLSNEVKSFENLHNRYKGLNQTDRGCININTEAQTFQSKCAMLIARFVNFIELVAAKIGYFVEENIQRSLNYSHKINNFAKGSGTMEGRQDGSQGPASQFGHAFYERDRSRNRQIGEEDNKHRYRSTMPTAFTDYGQNMNSNPNLGMERPMPPSPSAARCMNHNHGQMSMNMNMNTGGFVGGYTGGGYGHSVGFGESRFNYRDHLPKWANRTLASFYY